MKKIIPLLALLILTSCSANRHGNNNNNIMGSLFNSGKSNSESQLVSRSSGQASSLNATPVYDKIDIDLTSMSSTMVYSSVLNMLENPGSYIGKVVKMSGPFKPFYDETDETLVYPAIVIQDATACCASGFEFLLYGVPLCTKNGGDGYPNYEEEATIIGRFETYLEYGSMYVHLVDSIWVK